MTSVRGKRAVENIDDVYDRNDPPMQEVTETHPRRPAIQQPSFHKAATSGRDYKSKGTWPELTWRPRSKRIRRNRQVIDQSGLKIFLLLTQLLTASKGAQLIRERPGRRPRTGQPPEPRVRPCMAQWSNRTDHQAEARCWRRKQRAAVAKQP